MQNLKKSALYAAAVMSALGTLVVLYFRIFQTGFYDFNYSGLVAPCYGFSPYAGKTFGAIVGWIYGPMSLALFSPLCFIQEPQSIVIGSRTLGWVLSLAPIGWLVFRPRENRDIPFVLKVLIFTFFVIQVLPRFSAERAPDVGAVFFTMCGAILLDRLSFNAQSLKWSALSAALIPFVLAGFCKQTFLPLAFIPFVFVAARKNLGNSVKVLLMTVGLIAICGIVAHLIFGESLWFNLFELPSRQPWVSSLRPGAYWVRPGLGSARVLLSALLVFIEGNQASLLLVGASWLCLSSKLDAVAGAYTRLAKTLLAAFLLSLPLGALTMVKIGGTVFGFSQAAYFLNALLVLLLLELSRLEIERSPSKAGKAALACLCVVTVLLYVFRVISLRETASVEDLERVEQAHNFLKSHDGIYFPDYPLAHLTANGKFVHGWIEFSLREAAGYKVASSHIHSHLPTPLKGVAIMEAGDCESVHLILDVKVAGETEIPELSRFKICRIEP